MLKPTTLVFLIALSILAGVHFIALELYLYWHYVWFDLPMHLIGGSVVVLGVYALSELSVPPFKIIASSGLAILCFLVAVMLAWEVFEVWAGIPIEDNYWFDTSIDIVMGFLGGAVGYFVANRLREL